MKPALVTTDVRIGAAGPYRFLVDTGAQSSMIDASLAAALRIQPRFRVELVTPNGVSVIPGASLDNLSVGSRALPATEVLFHDLTEPRRLDPAIRGVLGLAALSGTNFLFAPSTGRLDTTAGRPAGHIVPFRLVEGRIVLTARMSGEPLSFVLDSGATHVVLYKTPAAMQQTPPVPATLRTMAGEHAAAPTRWTSAMIFGNEVRVEQLPAAIVQRSRGPARADAIDGLLPASVFKQIYVDFDRRELVVNR